MSEYRKGQRVHIELEGEIAAMEKAYSLLEIRSDDGGEYCITTNSAFKVTLADPKDWPPQVGDIWLADGKEYYVRQNQASSRHESVIGPFDITGEVEYYQDSHGQFKALSPVLVRRRKA